MRTVYPDYYKDFKCIASKCKHSCCIGWEIDIDEKSLEFYQNVQGEFGKKLKDNISLEGTPHFVLSQNERCPFLNHKNLCDIYTQIGENRLCQICSDHPRFYNELEDRVEAGLGLCCEEAARLIITKKEPFKLSLIENETDGLFLLRERCFNLLQDRSKTIRQRIGDMLSGFNHPVFENAIHFNTKLNISSWGAVFESLERLDQNWTDLLLKLNSDYDKADKTAFAEFIKPRETEYEQFLCYLIYRHVSKAEFMEDFLLYTLFAVVSFELIYAMGAVIFTEKGDFSVEDQLNIMRLFSSEIEYSDENIDIILNTLETEFFGY